MQDKLQSLRQTRVCLIKIYEMIIEKYFETDFNRRGKHDGEITLCLSHFMNNKIVNFLINREGILWERCYDD